MRRGAQRIILLKYYCMSMDFKYKIRYFKAVTRKYGGKKEGKSMYWLCFIGMMIVIVSLAGLMSGGMNIAVLDLPSLLMILLIGISVLIASGLWKDFVNAFRFTMGKDKKHGLSERKRAKEAVELLMKATRYGGMFIALMNFANIYNIPDDPWAWRANLVVMSLTLLYAYAINVLLLPVRSRLNVGIIEYMQAGDDE